MNIESMQPRLIVGPLHLVLHNESMSRECELWALPGGGYASLPELNAICADNNWPSPRRLML